MSVTDSEVICDFIASAETEFPRAKTNLSCEFTQGEFVLCLIVNLVVMGNFFLLCEGKREGELRINIPPPESVPCHFLFDTLVSTPVPLG